MNILQFREGLTEDFDDLRQIKLLSESSLLTFVKDRGIRAFGVVEGEPGDFHRRGWLRSDGIDYDGGPLFHPFRLYPLHKIMEHLRVPIAPPSALDPTSWVETVEIWLKSLKPIESITARAEEWNDAVDLAILLEPIFWPYVAGLTRFRGGMREEARNARIRAYREKIFEFLRGMDAARWRKTHESILCDAAWMDGNSDLYLLLRVAHWGAREKLKGRISGALWLRHMAEMIRRGFEEACAQEWPEEDWAFGHWPPGARKHAFGSERPLDTPFRSKRYLAYRFGLFTGSAIRWYVEGHTEYYAVLEAFMDDPGKYGVEVVNLRGNVKSEDDNIALKLQDALLEDQTFRRFSIISFDKDVPENVRAVRRQLELAHVVGHVAANDPDFEFANFSVEELAEIAGGIDDQLGFDGEKVRAADWSGVGTGRDFEARYGAQSERKGASLKGEAWGRAIARFALEHPHRSGSNADRPFVREVRMAFYSWHSQYDRHQESFQIDPITFELIPKRAGGLNR